MNTFVERNKTLTFASPRKLAEYLQYLAGNDTAYEEYLCWKTQCQRIRTRCACELCKQLHNQSLYTPSRVYTNMAKFWNRKQWKNSMHQSLSPLARFGYGARYFNIQKLKLLREVFRPYVLSEMNGSQQQPKFVLLDENSNMTLRLQQPPMSSPKNACVGG